MSFYCAELPYRSDAGDYFAAIADLPWAAWLDSGGLSRYDILTASPHRTLAFDETCATPFESLREHLGPTLVPLEGIPFAGGALGYWSYDLARQLMSLPNVSRDDERLPLVAIGIYDWALVLDHHRRTANLVSHGRCHETGALLPQLLQRFQEGARKPTGTFDVQGRIESNFSRDTYRAAFDAVQAYLRSGDCYQVNLAQRFSAAASGDALHAYLELRRISPAPYAAFLNLPRARILCASPERFLSVRNGKVETKPIKGTRPRGRDAAEDERLAADLRIDPKDRAENLMIVDLLRNDLGKSCVPGSVRVPRLFEVESYSNVHHLVSTVEGELSPEHDALDLLRDCFPGGSITGAPKRRAMEIIEQLEPNRRGVYCGAIGYVGFDGNMDTNIAIRTLAYSEGTIRCWVGGGIVADSQCDAEYQETLDKASAMLGMLQKFGGIRG